MLVFCLFLFYLHLALYFPFKGGGGDEGKGKRKKYDGKGLNWMVLGRWIVNRVELKLKLVNFDQFGAHC